MNVEDDTLVIVRGINDDFLKRTLVIYALVLVEIHVLFLLRMPIMLVYI